MPDQVYTITEMSDPEGDLNTTAADINDSGQQTGYYDHNNGNEVVTEQAYFYDGTQYLNLQPTNALYSQGTAINNRGVVVGAAQDSTGASFGFSYQQGTYTILQGGAVDINDGGQIAGNYATGRFSSSGYIYTAGSYVTISDPDAPRITNLAAINNSGQAVGTYFDADSSGHGFLYSGGQYATIDDPNGFATSIEGINASAQIVGTYRTADSTHSFVYAAGAYTDIVDPDGTATFASAINDAGQVVGSYTDAQNSLHSFVYDHGVYTTIEDPAWNGSEAVSINSQGQIFGQYNIVAFDPTFVATPVCYVAGTLIHGADGDVPIELLAIGDLVVTASGAHRPIRWLGHRVVDCRRHPRPHEVMPVRIAAHAFGEGRPTRDLRLSPGHAICVDLLGEVLIPAAALINGATIVQEEIDSVTYWHVELDSHDVILAENLPCESYLEMGNRSFFAGGAVMSLDASPDAPVPTHADFCRPFHADGALVAFARERLAERTVQQGWRLVETPTAGVHLMVDGRRIEPEVRDLAVLFLVPAGAESVWLVSDTAVPAQVDGTPDPRALGVCIGRLVVDDGFAAQVVAADDPRLTVGFHAAEAGPQRWTAGRARLPSELWAHCRGAFFLRLETTRSPIARWVRREVAESALAMAG